MRVREYGVLGLLALIWGASFLFIKIAVSYVSPATLVAGRVGSSVLVLGALAWLSPKLIAGWRRYAGLAFVVGVVNIALPYLLISWGEKTIPSGNAAILNATTPLFTVLLAHFWRGSGREGLTLPRIGGVVIGFLGVALLIGPNALNNGAGNLLGDLAVLLAAFLYAIGALGSTGFEGSGMLVGSLGEQVGALIVVLPVAAFWSPPTQMPPPVALAAILELGIPGLAVAYILFFWLIRNVGASRTTLVTYLLPCTALVWGAIFLHEQPGWNALGGLVLVLFGMMVANGALAGVFGRRPRVGNLSPAVVAPGAAIAGEASDGTPPANVGERP